ncbi:MAG TPA: MoaD/ThiS family protein [Holophagaceae bacterium]|nr:MoaD/ThiS family protein [Holophagaceae bacterium]
MAHLVFTGNLQRHVACPPGDYPGATVAEVLESAFRERPLARGYVLDERGSLRHHMVVFVDGTAVADRTCLGDPVGPGAQVYVMQALSGG